jgi:hypothetical protein
MTPMKCVVLPAAVVAKTALSGLALHQATNSASDVTRSGTAGPITNVNVDRDTGQGNRVKKFVTKG